jgi:exodeoxyribonuclease VII large subunit
MQVLVQADVSLYEARGNYQLIVSHLEEAGDGALRRAFEALKQRLYQEGLFAEEHKRALPALPRCIGVVTSPGGAAIRDVLSVLRRRFPAIPVIIYPTLVQGDQAAGQIVRALQLAEQRAECDVLLLTRGGGSLEDLWPFNEERVARAVFDCAIPVVSAVGHEVDIVISDFVADQRAPTPSAAAELLSPDQLELSLQLQRLQQRLAGSLQQLLAKRGERLRWLLHRHAQCHPGRRLQQRAQRLDELELRLVRAWQHLHRHASNRCQSQFVRLQQYSPRQQLQRLDAGAAQLAQRLRFGCCNRLSTYREKLAVLSRALDTVSPLATLKRGYSITLQQSSGKLVQDARQVRAGDLLETRLARGRLLSQVVEN